MACGMTAPALAAASFCGITIFLHIVSIVVAAWRCRPKPVAKLPGTLPPVSIVRPVCGLDNFLEETLRTSFELAYPSYELIFCIASARDPAIGYCQGTPLRNEIEARAADRLDEATDVATAAIAARFGTGAVDGKIRAHIFAAHR